MEREHREELRKLQGEQARAVEEATRTLRAKLEKQVPGGRGSCSLGARAMSVEKRARRSTVAR